MQYHPLPMRQTVFVSVLAAAIVSSAVPSAQNPETVDKMMVEKIRREGLERSQVYAMFGHLVDVVGPRLTGTPAFKTAADWSRDQLSRWGLRDARLESWEFGRGWQLDQFTLEMVEPRYMPLIGYPEGWSASMSAEVTATPVFVGDKPAEQID